MGPPPARRIATLTPTLAAALWLAALAGLLAPLQLLSDDWAHVATVGRFASWRDAFDPHLTPLRPAQWLWFHALVSADAPALARLAAATLCALGLALTFALCRALGGAPRTAALATLLAAVYPNVWAIGWPAAVGWPGRHVGLLLGLVAFVHHQRRPRAWTALGVLAGQVAALAFHQTGVLLAPLCAAAAWSLQGRGALWAMVRRPLPWALLLVVLPYCVYVAWFRPERSASGAPLSSLPTGALRAAIVLWPASVRHLLEDAFRAGGVALAAAAPFALVGPALAARAVWRGGPGRLLAIAIVLDLALSTLASGFMVRYALTASALFAVALALWSARGGALRIVVVAALALGWAVDSARDVARYRAASALVADLLDAARQADRGLEPGRALVLVDVPGELDRDLQVPLFRYGLLDALRARGIARDVRLLTATARRGAQPSRHATAAELDRELRDDRQLVLRFADGRLAPVPPQGTGR
ncbi:MAG: hypothetical protein IPM29_19545 [Planctomycetes bacterium]|nr:hypothetical protein [Planctomycetota bacterium]